MTEADLQTLLHRAAWRQRLADALVWSLHALIASLFLVAAVVFDMRWIGREFAPISMLAALPWLLAAATGALALILVRPSLPQVAAMLDRRADTHDHVTTWLYLRGIDAAQMNTTQRGFRDAQRQSALGAARAIRLKTHAPIAWPRWSRAIWLALIFLLSAVLLPPANPNAVISREKSPGFDVLAGGAGGGGGSGKSPSADTLREAPRIQVLSPADRMKFELIASASDIPESMKCEALKQLTDAIGNIPESELTAAERQVLDRLRNDVGQDSSAKPKEGSVAATAAAEEKKMHPKTGEKAADFQPFSALEKAWAASESNFPDVRSRLNKYYGSAVK